MTPPSNSLGEIIKRLEDATGPDRELDCWVAFATGKGKGVALRDMQTGPSNTQKSWMVSHPAGGWFHPERYTASIDAALTLVPEGLLIDLACCHSKTEWWCSLRGNFPPGKVSQVYNSPEDAGPPNGAIALCIAALRARILASDGG